jgi:hypothetical protein
VPTQQQIFRRRRALAVAALAVLVTVIWGLPQLFNGPSASDVIDSDQTSTDVSNLEDCAPGVVSVEVMVGKIVQTNDDGTQTKEVLTNFDSSTFPALWYQITNKGSVDCKFNVGPRVTFYTISSGDQTYWSSKDCNREGLQDTIVELKANQTLEAIASEWEKSYSSETGCGVEGNDTVPAAGATYKIRVEVSGVLSEEKRFVLN